MSPTNNPESIDELIRDIEDTAEQVHEVLSDLNDSKIELAVLKSELKTIVENVKELSQIIRVGGGDGLCVISRIAIIEQAIREIKTQLIECKESATKVAVLEQGVSGIYKTFDNYNTKIQSVSLLEQKVNSILEVFNNYNTKFQNLTIMEQRVDTITEILKNYNTKAQSKELSRLGGKWNLYVALASGLLAILGTAISILLQHC